MLGLTTNQDLNKHAKRMRLKKYRGVFMRDEELPPLKDGKYIFNLDDESNTGTHWTALIVTTQRKPNIYFDSMGFSPPEEIIKFAKSKGDELYYSTVAVQDDNSSACGYFVLYFLKYIQNTGGNILDSYYDFTHKLLTTDTKRNEKKLTSYFKKP